MAQLQRTPTDVARVVDEVLESPEPQDRWIDRLPLDRAVIECHRRGLATGGIVPTLRDRIRRYERAAREALDPPVVPGTEAPSEDDIRVLGRRPAATGTPCERESEWFGKSAAVQRGPFKDEKSGDSWLRRTGMFRTEEDDRPSGTRERRAAPRGSSAALKEIRQWGVSFSGERDADADAFLISLREGRRISNLRDDELLDSLPFVLGGVARLWYRAKRESWRGWASFERAFRSRFAAPNFQLELNKEIIRRTQGESEPIADYIACMLTLLARLDPQWPLQKQLDYVHGNMLPRFQLALRRNDFADFDSLEVMAMGAETQLISVGRYRPPPPPDRSLMPSTAYRPPTRGTRTRGAAVAIELPEEGYDDGYDNRPAHRVAWRDEEPGATAAVMTRAMTREECAPVERRAFPPRVPGADGYAGEAGRAVATRPAGEPINEPRYNRAPVGYRRSEERGDAGRGVAPGRVRTGRCWRCGLQGHFARECPEPLRQHCQSCNCRPPPVTATDSGPGNEPRGS